MKLILSWVSDLFCAVCSSWFFWAWINFYEKIKYELYKICNLCQIFNWNMKKLHIFIEVLQLVDYHFKTCCCLLTLRFSSRTSKLFTWRVCDWIIFWNFLGIQYEIKNQNTTKLQSLNKNSLHLAGFEHAFEQMDSILEPTKRSLFLWPVKVLLLTQIQIIKNIFAVNLDDPEAPHYY